MFNYVHSIEDIEKETGLDLSKLYLCNGIMIMNNFNITKVKNIEEMDISEFEILSLNDILSLPDYYFRHKNIIVEIR